MMTHLVVNEIVVVADVGHGIVVLIVVVAEKLMGDVSDRRGDVG